MNSTTLRLSIAGAGGTTPDRVPEVQPGCILTEVGLIPEDWQTLTLGDIATFKTGPFGSALHKSDYITDGVPLINPMHIVAGQLVPEATTSVSCQAANRLEVFRLRPNDIVIGRRGDMGRCAVVQESQSGWLCGTGSLIIRCSDQIDVVFVQRVLTTPRAISSIESSSVGTTMVNLNQSVLAGLKIQSPPLPEQHAISEALSGVDNLLTALEALIAKKRAIKQAAMQQLLTGKTRLSGFSGEWDAWRIAEIATPVSERNSVAAHLPVLTCSKHLGFVDSLKYFKNQVFSKDLSRYRVIRRNQIGYPANHIEEGSIGLQDLYDAALVSPIYVIFSPNEGVNSYFLHRLLKLDSYRQKFSTATNSSVDRRGSLRWPSFSNFAVCLPPSSEEQTSIATVLSDMDAEIAALEARRTKTQAIKQGMMQQLLTGRVRLVKPAKAEANA